MVRLAKPDCDGSSVLMATMVKESGEGAEPGAVYTPLGSIAPQAPDTEHAVPRISQTTV
jgi:hypothetical protein